MKRRTKTILIIIISIAVGLVLTLGGLRLAALYLDQQYSTLNEGCAPRQAEKIFTIKDNVISPSNIVANRCETLTVINLDDTERMIAFGVHDHHTPYNGFEEKVLQKDQKFTVTLVQTGSFKVHDHHDDDVKATFEVK